MKITLARGWDTLQDGNNGSSEKVNYTKFDAGEMTEIRCLTNEPVLRWSHYLPMAKRSVTCIGKGCPACDAREQAKSAGVQPKISTSKKFAMIIYNFKTKQVEILEQGKAFIEQLYGFHTEIGDITKYNIKVKRIGEKTNTTYTLIPCAESELDYEGLGIDMDNLPDLAKQFKAPTKEQMLALMDGKSPQEVFGNTNDNKDEDDEEFEI